MKRRRSRAKHQIRERRPAQPVVKAKAPKPTKKAKPRPEAEPPKPRTEADAAPDAGA
jgi:hypothetical protein